MSSKMFHRAEGGWNLKKMVDTRYKRVGLHIIIEQTYIVKFLFSSLLFWFIRLFYIYMYM